MDLTIQEIREIAEIMKENGLHELEISEDSLSIKMQRLPVEYSGQAASIGVIGGADGPTAVYQARREVPAEQALPAEPAQPQQREGRDVLSPTVGVFYAAPSPESEEYVKVGSKVKKGDVLCIIEAMKLMNEIPAEFDGTVAEVYVGNGQVVEYDQPLFRIV